MTKYENLDFSGLEEALRTPSSGYRVTYDADLIKQPATNRIEYLTTALHPLLNEHAVKAYADKAFKQEGLAKVVCIHAKNILSMMGRKDPLVIFIAVYEKETVEPDWKRQEYECHQMRLTELYNLF